MYVYSPLLGILFAGVLVSTVLTLECGFGSGPDQNDIKSVVKMCASSKGQDFGRNATNSANETITATEDKTEEEKSDGSDEKSQEGSTVVPRKELEGRGKRATKEETSEERQHGSDDCQSQCVLEHLGMTDSHGMPDHNKLSNVLLKNARNKELRDFLQDTADECFRSAKEEEQICEKSTKLLKCLANKGRRNCGDWPVGEISFLH